MSERVKFFSINDLSINYYIKIVKEKLNNFDKSITEILSKLKILYSDDFLELFEKYEVFKKINKESFKKIINKKEIPILKILFHKKLVQ